MIKKNQKLSTEKEMTNEILDNLYLMTRSHKYDCICRLCEFYKFMKAEAEQHNINPERPKAKDDPGLTIEDLKREEFVPIEDSDKRFKDIKIKCPICGDSGDVGISKRIKFRNSYIKNEYVLDCGHFIRVGGRYMIEDE